MRCAGCLSIDTPVVARARFSLFNLSLPPLSWFVCRLLFPLVEDVQLAPVSLFTQPFEAFGWRRTDWGPRASQPRLHAAGGACAWDRLAAGQRAKGQRRTRRLKLRRILKGERCHDALASCCCCPLPLTPRIHFDRPHPTPRPRTTQAPTPAPVAPQPLSHTTAAEARPTAPSDQQQHRIKP